MKKTQDYIHHYRGYWSDGGRCRIRIYREDGHAPVVICSQLQDNENTSVTWIEHYQEHEGGIGVYSLVRFSDWELEEVCLGGSWRLRVGVPSWSHLRLEEVKILLRDRAGEQRPPSTVEQPV